MRIGNISTNFDHGMHRMTADVEGAPIWFESADIALSPSPEAFAGAMLIPAIARGETLTLEDSLSAIWLSNVSRILPVFREWWDYPELSPQPASVSSGAVAQSESTALCFSGGVDSFYTLLRSGHTINYLVFVIGFDMKLDDCARFEAFKPSLRAAASAVGAHPVVIRTNIREHPAFEPVSWECTHGGAMAAIGHLLSDRIGRLLVSSSRVYTDNTPWGSSWRIDKFWSSERLEVVHAGAELHRSEKLREIIGEPLVREHLRVCWENRAPSGNCGRCEKCVRTRLALLDCGELANFTVFEGKESLALHIDELPPSRGRLLTHRRLVNQDNISLEIKRALRGLIERTDRAKRQAAGADQNFLGRIWSKRWHWMNKTR
ncbi:MAG: hypothetical protein AB7U82_11850 [Blastocatellales bacterium]